jgi:hypothetical protein
LHRLERALGQVFEHRLVHQRRTSAASPRLSISARRRFSTAAHLAPQVLGRRAAGLDAQDGCSEDVADAC